MDNLFFIAPGLLAAFGGGAALGAALPALRFLGQRDILREKFEKERAEIQRLREENARLVQRNAELRDEVSGYHRLESEMRLLFAALKKKLAEEDDANGWKSDAD